MNGEPTRRRPISLAELAGVPPRRRATLAVDTGQWLRKVTARAQLPAELLSALVQAYVVTVLREPQAKTPEGRSAVLRDIRDLLEDAVFAGIKAARSPDPEKRPLPPTPLGCPAGFRRPAGSADPAAADPGAGAAVP